VKLEKIRHYLLNRPFRRAQVAFLNSCEGVDIMNQDLFPTDQTPPNRETAQPRRRLLWILLIIGSLLSLIVIAVSVGAFLIYRPISSDSRLLNSSDQKVPKTKLEAFQAKAGRVLVKSYSEVGTVGGQTSGLVAIEALELQDRSDGSRALGLIIEVKPGGEYSQTSRSFIDYDEIDSLLKGIDYISNVTTATPPLKNFEALYQTRGNFSVVTFNQSDGKISASVSGGLVGSSRVYLTTQGLLSFRQWCVSAKETLGKLNS
jgi:hypothetical protein